NIRHPTRVLYNQKDIENEYTDISKIVEVDIDDINIKDKNKYNNILNKIKLEYYHLNTLIKPNEIEYVNIIDDMLSQSINPLLIKYKSNYYNNKIEYPFKEIKNKYTYIFTNIINEFILNETYNVYIDYDFIMRLNIFF